MKITSTNVTAKNYKRSLDWLNTAVCTVSRKKSSIKFVNEFLQLIDKKILQINLLNKNLLKALAIATLARTATVGMMNMPTPSSSTTSGRV